MALNEQLAGAMESHLLHATKAIEEKLDNELHKLDNLDTEDIDVMRERRLMTLKKQQEQRQHWVKNGHGKYFEIADESSFFEECKKSKNVVCHFYRDSTFRCKIVDKHLEILAPKHLECKFMKVNAEKVKFLSDRLRIKVIPTICLIKDKKTKDYIVGFNDLGDTDEFTTDVLEWRIALAEVIDYSGDLLHPPGSKEKAESESKAARKNLLAGNLKSSIRSTQTGDESDDNDW